MSGLWCIILRFSQQRLAEAAYQQMLKLPYYPTFAHKANDIGIELAEKLLSIAPAAMSKVFFTPRSDGHPFAMPLYQSDGADSECAAMPPAFESRWRRLATDRRGGW
jgi:hypothetical protein